MGDAIGKPRQDVEDRVFVCGQDVAEIGAVEDVFEGREDADPDWWSVFA